MDILTICGRTTLPAAAAAVGLSLGCGDFTRDPVSLDELHDEVGVHALLIGGADSASVLLARPAESSFRFEDAVEGVSGAEVELRGTDRTVALAEAPPGAPTCFVGEIYEVARGPDSAKVAGPGCYVAPIPGGIRPEDEYELSITLPDGTLVQGTARPLPPPAIRDPEPGASIRMERGDRHFPGDTAVMTVGWTAAAPAPLVRIAVWPDTLFVAGEPVPDAACQLFTSTPDPDEYLEDVPAEHTVTAVVDYGNCLTPSDSIGWARVEAWDSLRVSLRVAVYDSTYASYFERAVDGGDTVAEDYASAGLDGAVGVFAGAGVADRRITLISPDTGNTGSTRR